LFFLSDTIWSPCKEKSNKKQPRGEIKFSGRMTRQEFIVTLGCRKRRASPLGCRIRQGPEFPQTGLRLLFQAGGLLTSLIVSKGDCFRRKHPHSAKVSVSSGKSTLSPAIDSKAKFKKKKKLAINFKKRETQLISARPRPGM
jgi:hypothetical protein